MVDVVLGSDGLPRCAWATSAPDYQAYHDLEWGRPVGDVRSVYETLCLEGFQAGLSWLTILRKRDGFRDAFAGFDPEVVAGFQEADVERLVVDGRIVRHRGKIVAAINNARATVELQRQGDSLAAIVWGHAAAASSTALCGHADAGGHPGSGGHLGPGGHRASAAPAPARASDIAPSTPGSKALSVELRRRGFVFVGPTTVYATMQALGVVNDHLQGCHWREVVEEERASFRGGRP